MVNFFKRFDAAPTRRWITIQVVLISLIVAGCVLLVAQRYWVPDVVSFLLTHTEPEYQHEVEIPFESVAVAMPEGVPLVSVPNDSASTTNNTPNTNTIMSAHNDVAFTISVPRTSERGSPVKISWHLKEMPEGASIGFFLKGGNLSHVGVPLTIDSMPLSEVSGSFEWDGDRYGCDPTDTPQYCTGIDTGEYTLTVVVYDKTDVSFVDGDTIEPVLHDEKKLYSASAQITITGTPHAGRIESFAQVIVKQINKDHLRIDEPYQAAYWHGSTENQVMPYITSEAPFTGPDAA